MRQAPRLARQSAPMSSLRLAATREKFRARSSSSASPFVLVEQAPQLFEFLPGRAAPFQGMHQQFAGGTFKNALQDVTHQLTFGFRCWLACFIDVRALAFVSADVALGGHNLEEFQDCGVAKSLLLAEFFVDLADSGWSAGPKDPKDFKFGSGGLLRRISEHGRSLLRRFSYCQRKSS